MAVYGVPVLLIGFIAAVLFIIILFLGGIGFYTGREYVAQAYKIVAGEHWAHWNYQPNEWQRYQREEIDRNFRENTPPFIYLVTGMVGFGVLVLVINSSVQQGLDGRLLFCLICLIGVIIASFVMYRFFQKFQERRFNSPGEIYISSEGLYGTNGYEALHGFGIRLLKVELSEATQPEMLFTIERRQRHGESIVERRIPVPAGKENEAMLLVERFQEVMTKSVV
ncbi:MAG TPA: hypothetical protein VH186_18625 [Chloroflexia bacterium]|nr:hypothetical protein [Chloroflexia bacterium]